MFIDQALELIQLLVFVNATTKAYAAVGYLRIQQHGTISIHFIAVKTKVAPLTCQSIPRLELCAALLASELLIQNDLQLPNVKLRAWSESTTALTWIPDPDPGRWTVFITNRVAKIQRRLPSSAWGYVNPAENPADIACRGAYPEQVIDNELYWKGPDWLASDETGQKKKYYLSKHQLYKSKRTRFAVLPSAFSRTFRPWRSCSCT